MRVLGWLLVLSFAQIAGAQTFRVETIGDRSILVVSASGEAEIVPDRATLGINIESQARSGADAAAQMSRIQTQIIDTLRSLGFRAPSVTTLNYGVTSFQPQPVRSASDPTREPERLAAMYMSRGSIRVDVTRLERLDQIAAAALAKGATGIATPSFSSTTADSARREAIVNGARQARAAAMAIAQALGGSLGKLIELTSNASWVPRFRQQQQTYMDLGPAPPPVALRGVAGGSGSSSPGEMVFVASVTTRWEFLPNR